MADITLSKAVRSNLLNLQSTAASMSKTQERLATGLKVNSALDNPTSFFTANSLNARASDLGNLLDTVSNAIQTVDAADNGISAITKLVQSAQSTARQALQDKSSSSTTTEAATSAVDSATTKAGALAKTLDTDVGPGLIGAPAVWDGSVGGGTGHRGEGIVFGILDSGINFGSPSFAAVDPIDGYAHVNPLGSGNFLGTCAPGGIDAGRCNDKLIGGYDFVCAAPGNTCGAANIREEPGFGDTNGHGSHVASTAAGNHRDAELLGNVSRISGVAPRANIVAFDICYTNTATGQGLCPNTSAVAAVNQAIADGVVDVINYSIGGGASPWSEAVSSNR